MTALVSLGLNENHLVELPPEIGKLSNLQMLGMCLTMTNKIASKTMVATNSDTDRQL
jgi:hypothetical protein